MKIITISGFAQHGKDTSASIIKNYFEERGRKCLIIRNGDYLKYICREYFGWDGNKDLAGRTLLQKIGTDVARKRNPDIWVDVLISFLKSFGEDYDYVLIPDVRFKNEIIKLKDSGFDVFSIWVFRNNFDNGLSEEQKNHESEVDLLDYDGFDRVFSINGGVDALSLRLKSMIETIKL